LAIDGCVYVYDKSRKLKKWMHIKVDRAISLSISQEHVFCGCVDGVIRIFGAKSMELLFNIPKPPPLGQGNEIHGSQKKVVRYATNKEAQYADVIALVVD
jgi:hypothetical protein